MSAEIKILIDSYAQSDSVKETNDGLEKMIELLRQVDKFKDVLNKATELKDVVDATQKLGKLQQQLVKLQQEEEKLAAIRTKSAQSAAIGEEQIAQAKNKTVVSTLAVENATKKATQAGTAKVKQSREELQIARLTEKQNKSLEGSYNQISAKLGLAQIKLKALSKDQRENSAEGQALTKTVATYQQQLISLDAKVGVHTRNVGNYTGALSKLAKGVGGMSGLLFEFGEMLGLDSEAFQKLHKISTEFIRIGRDFTNERAGELEAEKELNAAKEEGAVQSELLGAAETEQGAAGLENVAATEAQTVAQEELNAAQEANPVGLIIAGILALGAAITATVEVYKKQTAEEKKMDTAIDGTVIKSKEAREEHNKMLYSLQKLQVQYDLISGAINDYQAAIKDIEIETNESLTKLTDDTNEKLKDATGFWHTAWTGMKDYLTGQWGDMVDIASRSNKEITDIQEEGNREQLDAIKEANKKIEVEQERHEIEMGKASYQAVAKAQEITDETLKLEHSRNLASLRDRKDADLLAVNDLKASEDAKGILRTAIQKKYDYDVEQENLKHLRNIQDQIDGFNNDAKANAISNTKDELKNQADADLAYANLTITDDAELANKRIAIKNQLTDDLNALDKKSLEDKAALDIETVNREEISEQEKADIIIAINTKLIEDESALDKKAADQKLSDNQDEWDALIAQEETNLQAESDQIAENNKKILQNEKDLFDNKQKLRLLEAGDDKVKLAAAEKINATETMNKELEELDAEYYSNSLMTEEQYQTKKKLIIAQANADITKANDDALKQQISDLKDYTDQIFTSIDDADKLKNDRLNAQITKEDDLIAQQRIRAQEGKNNDLVFEEQNKAKLEQIQLKDEKKQAELKKVEAYYNLFAEYAKTDPNTAAIKAAGQIAVSELITAAFAEKGGIGEDLKETTTLIDGKFDKSHSSGDILTMISPKEGILTEDEVNALGGKEGFYDLKYSLQRMADNPLSDDLFQRQNEAFSQTAFIVNKTEVNIKPLEEKISELIKVTKEKPVSSFEINGLGHFIQKLVKSNHEISRDKGSILRRKKLID